MNGIETVPEKYRGRIREAIEARFSDLVERQVALDTGMWNGLSGYYGFTWRGMFLGVETDGYIHS